jgi:hypothetical protein
MDDEIKKIELETARLRLQREQLALQKEMDGKQLRTDVSAGFGELFRIVGSIIGFCFLSGWLLLVGAFAGVIIWFLSSMLFFFPKTNVEWSFMARVGGALGSMGEGLVSAIFILPMLYFLIAGLGKRYGKK